MPLCALVPALVALIPAPSSPEMAVAAVLDDWHAAAARADEAAYFAHLAGEAVFLGTDGAERWDKRAFLAFAHPFFAKGRAWSFKAVKRTVAFAAGGSVAYFDEDLDTGTMGPCRGSGVLEHREGNWKILQYNLSIPIPNPLTQDLTDRIAAHQKAKR